MVRGLNQSPYTDKQFTPDTKLVEGEHCTTYKLFVLYLLMINIVDLEITIEKPDTCNPPEGHKTRESSTEPGRGSVLVA